MVGCVGASVGVPVEGLVGVSSGVEDGVTVLSLVAVGVTVPSVVDVGVTVPSVGGVGVSVLIILVKYGVTVSDILVSVDGGVGVIALTPLPCGPQVFKISNSG